MWPLLVAFASAGHSDEFAQTVHNGPVKTGLHVVSTGHAHVMTTHATDAHVSTGQDHVKAAHAAVHSSHDHVKATHAAHAHAHVTTGHGHVRASHAHKASRGHPGFDGDDFSGKVNGEWEKKNGVYKKPGLGTSPLLIHPDEAADTRLACPVLKLPESFYSSPEPEQSEFGWTRQGLWETHDGAALANWAQTGFGQETQIDIYVMQTLFAHMSVSLLNATGDEWLPGQSTQINITNCQDDAVYYIVESCSKNAPLKVYNEDDELLATARVGDVNSEDTLSWLDKEGRVIAVVDRMKLPGEGELFGGVPHYKFEFVTGIAAIANHTLGNNPNMRWVLLAATQARALRSVDRDDVGNVQPGPFQVWSVVLMCMHWSILLVAVVFALWFVFVWIYFPHVVKESLTISFKKAPEEIAEEKRIAEEDRLLAEEKIKVNYGTLSSQEKEEVSKRIGDRILEEEKQNGTLSAEGKEKIQKRMEVEKEVNYGTLSEEERTRIEDRILEEEKKEGTLSAVGKETIQTRIEEEKRNVTYRTLSAEEKDLVRKRIEMEQGRKYGQQSAFDRVGYMQRENEEQERVQEQGYSKEEQ